MLAGQPPFDTIMTTPDILASQMIEEIGPLPDRWRSRYTPPAEEADADDEKLSLGEWLEELYFEDGKTPELTRPELQIWAGFIGRMLRFEPADRASATELLRDECLALAEEGMG